MQDIVKLLQERAAQAPAAIALHWMPLDGEPERVWTRAELLDDVQRTAAHLAHLGVKPGQRVLILSHNSPELILSWFACAWLGAVAVLINPKCTAEELAYMARHTSATGLIRQPSLPQPSGAALNLDVAWTLETTELLPKGNLDACAPATVDEMAPAFMMFTSGTTSRPKAVVWSRANVAWAAQSARETTTLTAQDVAMLFVPLYHIVGLAWTFLPALHAGATVVLMPRFSGTHFWPIALKSRATFAAHVQFSTAALAQLPVPDSHNFRLWCNSTWIPDYEARFRVPIIGWWGMTELVAPGIVGHVGRAQTPGTIGTAADGYELRIAGMGRNQLRAGDLGDLEVLGRRGETIFSGYYQNPAAEEAAFTEDGWFRTGDRVRVHNDGSIQFVERSRDVIKTGGEGVSPAEVERIMRQVPGVSDAALVGKPDAVLGEIGVAFIVLNYRSMEAQPVIEAVKARCEDALAKFKVPKEFRVIELMPLVGINKIAKGELRRLALLPDPSASTTHA